MGSRNWFYIVRYDMLFKYMLNGKPLSLLIQGGVEKAEGVLRNIEQVCAWIAVTFSVKISLQNVYTHRVCVVSRVLCERR